MHASLSSAVHVGLASSNREATHFLGVFYLYSSHYYELLLNVFEKVTTNSSDFLVDPRHWTKGNCAFAELRYGEEDSTSPSTQIFPATKD